MLVRDEVLPRSSSKRAAALGRFERAGLSASCRRASLCVLLNDSWDLRLFQTTCASLLSVMAAGAIQTRHWFLLLLQAERRALKVVGCNLGVLAMTLQAPAHG